MGIVVVGADCRSDEAAQEVTVMVSAKEEAVKSG